jgi:hypothetical protein
MAKFIGYFDDNSPEMYSEGPYVGVYMGMRREYRIEKKGEKTSHLLSSEEYNLLRQKFGEGCWMSPSQEKIALIINWLNKRV